MKYNGLKNDLNVIAKFVFIYETEIKHISKLPEFSHKFAKSHNTFIRNQKKLKIKYAKTKEINDYLAYNQKYTFYMTKQKFQIWDFCRHIRNSFSHALLLVNKTDFIIKDINNKHITACGTLNYKLIKEFIVEIINEYEDKN